MRPLRRLPPGALWFVTVRCEGRRFRLRPDAQRTELVGFHLAAANAQCPGIRIFAVCQMGNHLHLVLEDQRSELSRFMMHFNGLLARALNGLDHVQGRFFERRFTASPIVDQAAVLDRIVYTLSNPAAAGLVASCDEWPGVIGAAATTPNAVYSRFERRKYEAALRRARDRGETVEREDFIQRQTLTLHAPPGLDDDAVRAAIDARQRELDTARDGGVVGVHGVLAVDPFDAPNTRPKRTPIPFCHATSAEVRRRFREGWRAFVDAYRYASQQFRAGNFTVRFPDWVFRPWVPLLA